LQERLREKTGRTRRLSRIPLTQLEHLAQPRLNTLSDPGAIKTSGVCDQDQRPAFQSWKWLMLELLRIEIHLCHYRQRSGGVAGLNYSRQIGELLDAAKFNIHSYQRDYAWKERQINECESEEDFKSLILFKIYFLLGYQKKHFE
jgi:hypothetical protein